MCLQENLNNYTLWVAEETEKYWDIKYVLE